MARRKKNKEKKSNNSNQGERRPEEFPEQVEALGLESEEVGGEGEGGPTREEQLPSLLGTTVVAEPAGRVREEVEFPILPGMSSILTASGPAATPVREPATPSQAKKVDDKMSIIQDVLEENEELKTKIKERKGEIQQLRKTSDKNTEDLSKDLLLIEKDIEKFANIKKKAEQDIREAEEEIEYCLLNISIMKKDQEAMENQAQKKELNLKAAEDDLKNEIKELKHNLESNLKTVDDLIREGIEEGEEEGEDSEPSGKQKLISFLTKSMEEKEEAILVKESDLECPVCLQIAGGEIFSCVQQHLICSQCRPDVEKDGCPECRQPYPPDPLRHTFAEKIAVELEKLREELDQIVLKLIEEGEEEGEDSEPSGKQKLISFLTKSMEEKEEAILVKESDLECPVCLQIAGGEIFSCVQQHLICSQCRPDVEKDGCPECRQPYPPDPLRHRFAEKIAVELEKLREELDRIVLKLNDLIV